MTLLSIPHRSRRRGQSRRGHLVPLLASGLIAALAVTAVAYLLWPTWASKRLDNTERLPVSVGETLFNVPPQAFLGQLGMPGMTAYFGLLTVAEAKKGDVVFVSAAAGAVGSTVVQIAKARGMIVIGSAGGADKCSWVRSLGADHVIDYKAETSLLKQLAAAAPDGIDVYFDNVGGEHLDAALATMRMHARLAICGMIDIYNSAKPTELRYLARIIAVRARMQGFLVSDYMARAGEFYRDMGALLAAGKLKSEETIHDGLDAMPDAFLGLFAGGNTGKMLVRV